jgi:ABC-type branched-subunit amino acid transport system substrate-binding protein
LVVPGALAVVTALAAAGCSSGTSTPSTSPSTSAPSTTAGSSSSTVTAAGPGVTATSINVGAISTRTGSIAADFDGLVPGIQAYFDMVNAEGGINGRKLNLAYDLDDGGQPSQFTQLTHTLIDQDHAFAVMVASYWFTPNYFVETKTPTYGYNVSGNWANAPNLFGAGGNSVQNYAAGVPGFAYFVKTTHSKSVAVISYGPAITSSYDACNTTATILQQNGYHVSYVDVGAQLGGSYSSAVQRMQQTGTDLVISCMQESDNITMARDIQEYGLKIKQLWLNGYDRSLLAQYSNLMEGVYLGLSGYGDVLEGDEQVRTRLHLQRGGGAGLAVGCPPGRRHRGGGERPQPGQHHQHHQSLHRQQQWRPVHGDQLVHRPHHGHVSLVQCHRPGPWASLRARVRQREPGLCLLRSECQEPCSRPCTSRHTGNVTRLGHADRLIDDRGIRNMTMAATTHGPHESRIRRPHPGVRTR